MNEDKVYTSEIVLENPFPGEELLIQSNGASPVNTYTPTTTKTKPFPKKIIAHETLAQALNTRSRKILQAFEFTPSGAINIGTFEPGLSGDVRITPNGITARDIAGLTTFSIDGTSGEAIFRGEVQAADFTVIDDNGLISLSSFSSDESPFVSSFSTTSSVATITGSEMHLELPRSAKALFLTTGLFYGSPASGSGDFAGSLDFYAHISYASGSQNVAQLTKYQSSSSGEKDGSRITLTNSDLVDLPGGSIDIELRLEAHSDLNFQANVSFPSVQYLILGR